MKNLLPVVLFLSFAAPAFSQNADWLQTKTADLSQLDQIRYAQLTLDEKAALQTLTAPALKQCTTADPKLDVADAFQHIRARRADLGGGTQGFVVEGTGCLCNAGNCEFWLVTSDMQTLFDGAAQTYALLPQLTNGRYDFVTASHVSTTQSARAYYTFDSKQYQPQQCAEISIANVFGNVQMKPTTTMKKCQ